MLPSPISAHTECGPERNGEPVISKLRLLEWVLDVRINTIDRYRSREHLGGLDLIHHLR